MELNQNGTYNPPPWQALRGGGQAGVAQAREETESGGGDGCSCGQGTGTGLSVCLLLGGISFTQTFLGTRIVEEARGGGGGILPGWLTPPPD